MLSSPHLSPHPASSSHSQFPQLITTRKLLKNYVKRNCRSRKCKFRNAPPRAVQDSTTQVNANFAKFKLNESTFLASLMPKKEIGADRFIEAHPEFDGRGVVIAIFGTFLVAYTISMSLFANAMISERKSSP